MASDDQLIDICKELGYHTEFAQNFDGTVNHDTVVVEFPCYAGKDLIEAKDMTAIKQLELVKEIQATWADNAVSVTVYYKPEELPEIKDWLAKNYKKHIKSVSFLLHNEHGFSQAPYEEITEKEYFRKIKYIKPITALQIEEKVLDIDECANGSCPIK